jgi:protein TonB
MRRCLLVSLSAHVFVLLPLLPVFELAGRHDAVLTISLDSSDIRPLKQGATRKTSTEKLLTQPKAPNAAASGPRESPERAVNADAIIGDSQHDTSRARVQARLLADLQRYFDYPLLARRRGWQGIVWLAFTLDTDGALQRIHVDRSSGYDVLDNSAIAALERVGPLSDLEHWLNGQTFDMRIPVIYQLQDN